MRQRARSGGADGCVAHILRERDFSTTRSVRCSDPQREASGGRREPDDQAWPRREPTIELTGGMQHCTIASARPCSSARSNTFRALLWPQIVHGTLDALRRSTQAKPRIGKPWEPSSSSLLSPLPSSGCARSSCAFAIGSEAMSFDLLLTVASAIGLTAYLFYVLARPERF